MDSETFKKTFGKNGGRRYPASEYSDRVMNLNRLEDRNYENQCRLIEKERRTVLTALNRDMKLLESELDVKQGLVRAIYNKERLKLLEEFPYKFTITDGAAQSYLRGLQQLGLTEKSAGGIGLSSSVKLAKKARLPVRVKKVHSAHGRFGGPDAAANTLSNATTTEPTPRTHRSASAFESYEVNESPIVNEVKSVLMPTNRPRANVIEASKQELYTSSTTPRVADRSNSIHDLSSSTTSTPKLPTLLPTDTVQVRPKDLKLVKLGKQSVSLDSAEQQQIVGVGDDSSPTSSTESYQIVMPSSSSSQNVQSPVFNNRFNYSPTSLKSPSPPATGIMPLPLPATERLPSMTTSNYDDNNNGDNNVLPISTTTIALNTRKSPHHSDSNKHHVNHHIHHNVDSTKKKSRHQTSIKTQF